MAVTPICLNCKFWEPTRIRNRGSCHRYPTNIEASASHWCGEHAFAETKAEEPKEAKKDKKKPEEASA